MHIKNKIKIIYLYIFTNGPLYCVHERIESFKLYIHIEPSKFHFHGISINMYDRLYFYFYYVHINNIK